MSEPNSGSQLQCYTDANGENFSRYGTNTDWVRVGPQLAPPAPSNPGIQLPSFRDSFHDPDPTAYKLTERSGYTFPMPSVYPVPQRRDEYLPDHTGYTYPPVASTSRATLELAVNTPLPEDDDDDFPPPHKILEQIARPSVKVAGARRPLADLKGKGKQKVISEPVASGSSTKKRKAAPTQASQADAKRPRGRTTGAANYSGEDLDALFDILEDRLPLGGNAWNSAGDEYNIWAEEHGRPSRTAKSLELKFKQLVKTTKPTGDAECPPHIQRAHEIDYLMNEKAGSRELDDEDIVDAEEDGDAIVISDDEDKENKKPTAKPEKKVTVKAEKTGPIARRIPADRIGSSTRASSRNVGQDLLTNISDALDPRTRMVRNEEHSVSALQSSQIFSLNSQLREVQRQVETLRTQLVESERQRNDAERRADRAELLNMIAHGAGHTSPLHDPHLSSLHPRPHDPLSRSRHHPASVPRARHSSPRHPRHRYRQEIYYRDGGRASTGWLGPSDDDSDEIVGLNDSPGTRRITIYEDQDMVNHDKMPISELPPRQARTAAHVQAPPATQSTTLRPAWNQAPSGIDVAIAAPHADSSATVSVVVSPCRNSSSPHDVFTHSFPTPEV